MVTLVKGFFFFFFKRPFGNWFWLGDTNETAIERKLTTPRRDDEIIWVWDTFVWLRLTWKLTWPLYYLHNFHAKAKNKSLMNPFPNILPTFFNYHIEQLLCYFSINQLSIFLFIGKFMLSLNRIFGLNEIYIVTWQKIF